MEVETVTVNEFDGAINFTIQLSRRLNIVAGENGTGKTRLLQAIKANSGVQAYGTQSFDPKRVFAINPKRNSERRELNQIVQIMRRENKSFTKFSAEAVNKHFNTGGFDNYSSFGELFMYYFDKLDRAGDDRTKSMNSVVEDFNSVISSVFAGYEISATWDREQGLPVPILNKRGKAVPIVGLSCGEAELFSLALNLYSLREEFDIFLIDEPETHLNWHLEKLLFKYLLAFSEQHKKQLVVATHSRVVVDPDFSDYSQFLYWNEDAIGVSPKLPKDQRDKIVEDAYQTLKVNGFSNPTIFCEDESHRIYLDELSQALNVPNYSISKCGTSSNVKSLYQKHLADGGWENCIFVVDGDSQGKWKLAGEKFIQIEKYCIENYAINLIKAAVAYGKSDTEIKAKLVELLKANKHKIFSKSKSLEFLVDLLQPTHMEQERIDQLDASAIFPLFLHWLGYQDSKDFWKDLFFKCADNSSDIKFADFVDPTLLKALTEWPSDPLEETS